MLTPNVISKHIVSVMYRSQFRRCSKYQKMTSQKNELEIVPNGIKEKKKE